MEMQLSWAGTEADHIATSTLQICKEATAEVKILLRSVININVTKQLFQKPKHTFSYHT